VLAVVYGERTTIHFDDLKQDSGQRYEVMHEHFELNVQDDDPSSKQREKDYSHNYPIRLARGKKISRDKAVTLRTKK